ncbi:hypothetical protein VCHC38A1_3310, partial [Vibrio cholerae HC-38A1]
MAATVLIRQPIAAG